jgi:hypothetical protein
MFEMMQLKRPQEAAAVCSIASPVAAAPWVYGITVETYEGRLADNLRSSATGSTAVGTSRCQARRTYIPKGGALDDLVLQNKDAERKLSAVAALGVCTATAGCLPVV